MENKQRALTIRDVARQAGVSISTASCALNGVPFKVKAETSERILRVASELGYNPNPLARNLKNKLTGTIGVFLSHINSPYYLMVVEEIEKNLAARGFDFIMGHIINENSRTYSLLKTRRVDGAIVLGPSFLSERHFTLLKEIRMPIVSTDMEPAPWMTDDGYLSLVLTENEKGTKMSVDHLVRLGRSKIGFIGGYEESWDSQVRYATYLDCLREYGLRPEGDYCFNAGYREDYAWIAAGERARAGKVPDAWIVANDQMAIGAMNSLHREGIRVPEDVAILGFDDIPSAEYAFPPLTTVNRDVGQSG